MRSLYPMLILGILTGCSAAPPPPQNLIYSPSPKLINQVNYEVASPKESGVEKVKRQLKTRDEFQASSSFKHLTDLQGKLTVSGSNFSVSISRVIAEKFIEDGFPDEVHVSGGNTNAIIQRFCTQGDIDIVDTSRLLTPEELETCQKFNRQPIAFPIARDKLALVVNFYNTFLPDNLSKEKWRKILVSEKWADVDPTWPKENIKLVFPIHIKPEKELNALLSYFSLQEKAQIFTKNNNTFFYEFVEKLRTESLLNPYVLGLLEYSYYKNNQDYYRNIAIDGIDSSQKNYPIERTLYIYADANKIKQRPALQSLINYYLTYSNDISKRLGYIPISNDESVRAKSQLANLIKDTK